MAIMQTRLKQIVKRYLVGWWTPGLLFLMTLAFIAIANPLGEKQVNAAMIVIGLEGFAFLGASIWLCINKRWVFRNNQYHYVGALGSGILCCWDG